LPRFLPPVQENRPCSRSSPRFGEAPFDGRRARFRLRSFAIEQRSSDSEPPSRFPVAQFASQSRRKPLL
jgi:hypothetical protein